MSRQSWLAKAGDVLVRVLEVYSRALYLEYPIYDEQGNVVGNEWSSVRGNTFWTSPDNSSIEDQRGNGQ